MNYSIKNIVLDIIGRLSNWFKKPHIQVGLVSGSPDYENPPIANVSQDWLKYLSLPFRTQWAGSFDEDNCATRSAIECLEAILNYYLANNLFPDTLAKFLKTYYCNKDGYVKLSIRYNAKLNNTTTQGANVADVWNNFNRDGFVPENVYPDPAPGFTWEQYYAPVPNGIEQYGQMSTKLMKVIWQTLWNGNWNVPDMAKLKEALQISPIYFASSVGQRDAFDIEQWKGDRVYQHARVVFNESATQDVLDSYQYPEYLRKLSQSFPLAFACKVAIKII